MADHIEVFFPDLNTWLGLSSIETTSLVSRMSTRPPQSPALGYLQVQHRFLAVNDEMQMRILFCGSGNACHNRGRASIAPHRINAEYNFVGRPLRIFNRSGHLRPPSAV
jgi:hypothetical protein